MTNLTKEDVDKLMSYYKRPFPKNAYFITSISDGIVQELGLEPGIYEIIEEEECESKS